MKQFFLGSRWIFSYILFLVVLFLTAAGYVQYQLGFQPCPLCQLQRILLASIGVITFFAILHHPKRVGIKGYSLSIMVLCFAGIGLASRQIFIQNHPPIDVTNACGTSLDYILETLPILEAIRFILTGNQNCAQIEWQFLGFSLAEWTLAAFTLVVFIAMSQYWRARKKII